MAAALSIEHLIKSYRSGTFAINDINLVVEEGDFFGLLGPNGAGKSTIIGVICSLVKKTSGKVMIFDKDIDKDFMRAKYDIGVVPQEFNFNQFEKTFDILVSQGGYYGLPKKLAEERAEYYLRKLGLWEKRDARSRFLSGGMKRRLMIARALVHEPRMLILDEPTAGVDIELRRSMWAFLQEINKKGITIILTTHYLEEAESLCRHIAIIDKGKIIENTSTQQLLKRLDIETFVLDTKNPVINELSIPDYTIRLINPSQIEVDVSKKQDLNQLFSELSDRAINIVSMRTKSNRLEELFVRLTAENSN